MIRHTAGGKENVAFVPEAATDIRKETGLQFAGDERFTVLGAEDEMTVQGGIGLRHGGPRAGWNQSHGKPGKEEFQQFPADFSPGGAAVSQ